MKILIDTQILIWFLGQSQRLSDNIYKILKNSKNEIIVSAVSIWEIAIKLSIGKITFPFELRNIVKEIKSLNISILEISSEHLIYVADLPLHHRDPFDRLIISQSILENLPIISSDAHFKKYNIKIIE